MNRFLLTAAFGLSAFALSSCNTNDVEVGGALGWLQSGAKIDDEPEPLAPDARLDLDDESEGGPIQFTMITDDRVYPDPPEKKVSNRMEPDPLERGREYRIKRLVR